MRAQGKKHKEAAERQEDSSAIFEGKTGDSAVRKEVITRTGNSEKRGMCVDKPQHSLSENQRFISQIRLVVDAGIDEQFSSGSPVVFPDRISQEFGLEYSTLEALFFQIQDVPIEKYILTRKVEKVKEVLVYADCPLQEIARLLGFEETARLSREFKKHTAYGPDYYIRIRQERLLAINKSGGTQG
ncbi:MAG: AraC family transcriptional regulator [Bacteroidetes bacterium]|nr:AraC family transcriptional regulator [Bacteroidota bacterium]